MMKGAKEYRIKKADFDDAAEIFKIGERTFKSYGTEDWSFSLVAEFLEEYPDFSYVVNKGDKIVAFVLARPYEDSTTKFYINWVAVNPKVKGKGLGTQMVQKVSEVAGKKGFKTIIVDTQLKNTSMQKILNRAGFKPIEREIYYIKKIDRTEK
jgi:ribosomal protein S18 acetylase RimI-like enzyme